MHALCSWAVPYPLLREAWPTACGWRPGEEQHPHLSMLALGNIPTRVEAFPGAIFVCRYTRLVPYSRLCRAFAAANNRYILVNTVVFLLGALRSETRTLFSLQSTSAQFSHRM